jgi:DNA-binding MarR family transcriptional regulator
MFEVEPEPEACNCSALRQAARHVTRLYDDALAPTGLGVNQFSILARLGHVGPSTIQDLARLLVMDRSTLGHLLRPLEKRGLTRLRVSEEDGRGRVAALTPAGRAAVARGRPLWARAQRRFASAFGEKGAVDLRTVLKKVATADFGDSEHEGKKRGRSQATATRRRLTD